MNAKTWAALIGLGAAGLFAGAVTEGWMEFLAITAVFLAGGGWGLVAGEL